MNPESVAGKCEVCPTIFKFDKKKKGYNRRSLSCCLGHSKVTVAEYIDQCGVKEVRYLNSPVHMHVGSHASLSISLYVT